MLEVVAALHKNIYMDNLLNGGQSVEQDWKRKSTASEIFSDAKFVLHKQNTNVDELEDTHDREKGDSKL